MQDPTQTQWKVPATWFALFNVLFAPVLGRVVWQVMLQMNTESLRALSVALSLVAAIAILLANGLLCRWARVSGMPRSGLQVMWLITGITFLLTIGFGFFSPINMLLGFLRFGAGG